MNKPRLKFEIYKYPFPLMNDDFDTEYDRERTYSKVFGKDCRIHVFTYYKAALNGMPEAIKLKEFEYDSPEYKEYYQLDELFREMLFDTTDTDYITIEDF